MEGHFKYAFNHYLKKKLWAFCQLLLKPVSAGVLENQDMRGGGQFEPPSKSHVWCPNMTNDTSLESSCAQLLESALDHAISKYAKMFAKF